MEILADAADAAAAARRAREEAMAAELLQTPPSQGPRPRCHFIEEAEVSGPDSDSESSGSDVSSRGLIDDSPREETPLADRVARHLELDRSGNPAARQRSRVGGRVSKVKAM